MIKSPFCGAYKIIILGHNHLCLTSVFLPCQIYFYLQYFLLELDLEDYLNPKLRHTVTLVGALAAT